MKVLLKIAGFQRHMHVNPFQAASGRIEIVFNKSMPLAPVISSKIERDHSVIIAFHNTGEFSEEGEPIFEAEC